MVLRKGSTGYGTAQQFTEPRREYADFLTPINSFFSIDCVNVNKPHIPVMLHSVVEALSPVDGANFADVTAGAGGHLAAICERIAPSGYVMALDQDERAFQDDAAGGVVARFPKNSVLLRANFEEIAACARKQGLEGFDGILADLGVSSMHFDEMERGFSFRHDGPIDMRMDTRQGENAYDLLARLKQDQLADLIFELGEERFSRRIARSIKSKWPMPNSTLELAKRVQDAVPGAVRSRRHPATKTFQALRMAVNRELDVLETFIESAAALLVPGGRLGIITFHSLEDRIVKNKFRNFVRESKNFQLFSKKPLTPSPFEVQENPRARSAKFRVLIRRQDDRE